MWAGTGRNLRVEASKEVSSNLDTLTLPSPRGRGCISHVAAVDDAATDSHCDAANASSLILPPSSVMI